MFLKIILEPKTSLCKSQIVASFGWFHTWDAAFSPQTSCLALFGFKDIEILEATLGFCFSSTVDNYILNRSESSQTLNCKVHQSTKKFDIPNEAQLCQSTTGMLHLSRLMPGVPPLGSTEDTSRHFVTGHGEKLDTYGHIFYGWFWVNDSEVYSTYLEGALFLYIYI